MAKDKLNTSVDNYFKSIEKVDVNKITTSMIKKYFNVGDTNDYGGVAHAIVNYEYDEDKVLRTIELLFGMGLDPNYKAKLTGYTFIHLALYGFTTSKGEDESYSTSFIVSLIEMAKKNGLDVNVKDKDGDTIVHTAFASEVYMGDVLPIIKALLPKFKMNNTDSNGRDILKAMDYYLSLATKENNKGWTNRIKRQKDEIAKFFHGMNEKEILKEKDKLDKKLDALVESLSEKNLTLKLDEIAKINQEYMELNELMIKNKFDFDKIYDKLYKKLTLILEKTLKEIVSNPLLKRFDAFEALIKKLPFYTPSVDISLLKNNYLNELKEYEKIVNEASSLEKIEQARELINTLLEEELKKKLLGILDEKVKKIKELLVTLSSLRAKNSKLINFLNMKEEISSYQDRIITILELESLIKAEEQRYSLLDASVKSLLTSNVEKIIEPFLELVNQGLMEEAIIKNIQQALPRVGNMQDKSHVTKVKKNGKK